MSGIYFCFSYVFTIQSQWGHFFLSSITWLMQAGTGIAELIALEMSKQVKTHQLLIFFT